MPRALSGRRVHGRSWLIVASGIVLATTAWSSPAWAHGAGETTEGYVLIQQALGHLAHDTGLAGVEAAMEKIDDALATKDQKGVDIAEVKQARAALETDRVEYARIILEHSIAAATSQLMTATGEETGTTVVLLPLKGRGALTGQDWALAAVSLLVILAGVTLAVRFRPRDNLRQLRRRMTPSAPLRNHERNSGRRT